MTLSRTNPRLRQRWGLLTFIVIALSFAFAASSLAVHDDNRFELDKNATNNLNVTRLGELGANINATTTSIPVCEAVAPPATPFTILIEAERMTVTATAAGNFGGNCGSATKRTYTVTRGAGAPATTATAHSKGGVEGNISLIASATKTGPDWNQVHAAVVSDPNTKCVSLGLVECSYIGDGIGPTTFIGGSSKDHLPVSGWQHTSGASPDKAEILNAYAAKAIGDDDHQILYFGMDRYAVDGSTDIGFWFFKEPVEAITAGPDAGTFIGDQSVGDVLILGTFTQGGAASNVRVFRWVGTGGNESGTIQGPDGTFGDCVPGAADDNGCATVNDTSIEVPWAYTFKGSAKSGWVPAGGFFEGGVDLTALGLDGCFSSFLAETRSSPEITAILKDFALGSFEACGSTLTTTPGTGASPSVALTDSGAGTSLPDVSIGTGTVSVKDKASLNITGISSWSGQLKFYLCGPITSGTCTAGSNAASPNGVLISTHNVTQATSQPIDSNAATITSVGRYCWRGEFTSSTTGVPNAKDDSAGECFEVLPVTPSLDTQVVASAVNFGQAVQDNATLSGTATQPGSNGPGDANGAYKSINATTLPPAGGKITFTLLKNDCSTNATGTGTNPQDVTVSGNGTYGPVSYTPDAPGTYHWKAQYIPATGDPNNVGSTHNAACSDSDETVVVQKAPTSITTAQSVYPNDSATVSVALADQGTGNVQGSVKFRLYDSLANCQATTPSDTVGTGGLLYKQTLNLPGTQFSSTVSTTNTTVSVSTNTTVYWLVEFTSTNTAQFGRNSVCSESTQTTFVNDSSGGTAPAAP